MRIQRGLAWILRTRHATLGLPASGRSSAQRQEPPPSQLGWKDLSSIQPSADAIRLTSSLNSGTSRLTSGSPSFLSVFPFHLFDLPFSFPFFFFLIQTEEAQAASKQTTAVRTQAAPLHEGLPVFR